MSILILVYNSVISLSEIEAQEACKWLRAAGFPQYAQMYEGECHFLMIKSVKKII